MNRMNRASSPTGWVRNPTMKLPQLDPTQASSYEIGYTLNPITGCRNHVEGLCKGGGFPCYAYRLAHGRLKPRYLANNNVPNPALSIQYLDDLPVASKTDPFWPRFWPERLADIPKDWKTLAGWQEVKSRGIFVCDMGELFGDWIPRNWQGIIFEEIRKADQHRFYLLTKQPQNLQRFSPFPDNCWVGVTATGYEAFNKALDYLMLIEAKVKYISIEPLLEAIPFYTERLAYCGISWLIIGAQTKPYKPPKIEHIKGIVKAADAAGTPIFLKDNLKPLMLYHAENKSLVTGYNHGESEFDGLELFLRQEMPVEVKEEG